MNSNATSATNRDRGLTAAAIECDQALQRAGWWLAGGLVVIGMLVVACLAAIGSMVSI